MLTFDRFTGINNVLPKARMGKHDLVEATNVDIGNTGELVRRDGYTRISSCCHKHLWQRQECLLAVVNHALQAIYENGTRKVIEPGLGSTDKVHYCDLPDGSTAYSNGLIAGATDGLVSKAWAIPVPQVGASTMEMPGSLTRGQYLYALSYSRLSDGLEGPAVMGAHALQLEQGGVLFMGLPMLEGHQINVYLSSCGGEELFFAGSTVGDGLQFVGSTHALQSPVRTLGLMPMPIGIYPAFWRGRLLVARGNVLWASQPHAWHLCDERRDFKQFAAPITLVQPVDDGIYVGTTQELVFLAGTEFDKLVYMPRIKGMVVPGSGVSAPGQSIKLGDGTGSGPAMVCIVAGEIVAGFREAQVYSLTKDRYKTNAQRVSAVWRETPSGIGQYVAIAQE